MQLQLRGGAGVPVKQEADGRRKGHRRRARRGAGGFDSFAGEGRAADIDRLEGLEIADERIGGESTADNTAVTAALQLSPPPPSSPAPAVTPLAPALPLSPRRVDLSAEVIAGHAAFFSALRRQTALTEFRPPAVDDIVLVPHDEPDARRAVAATPNGGCVYFAAGRAEGGPVQNVHWEGRIDVVGGKGRRVDFVSEEATTLCGKWQLLPESSGRWFGAQLVHRALANEVRAS